MRLKFQPTAIQNLIDIQDYISEHNPAAAEKTIDKITYSTIFLETYPLLGKQGRVDNTRELPVAGTKYIVVYSLPDAYTVQIETIIHGARKYP
jgi:plasmid stabilization system protein ParE